MCSLATLVCCLVAAVIATVCAQSQELYEGDTCKRVAGLQWTCKNIKDCAKAKEDLKNGLRPEICGFNGDEVIVCCEPTQTTTIRPTQPTRSSRPTPTKATTIPTPTQTTTIPTPTQATTIPTPTQTTTISTPTQTTTIPTPTQPTTIPTPTQTTTIPTPTQRNKIQLSRRRSQGRGGKSKQMCKKYAESVIHKMTSIDGQVHTFNLCTFTIEPLITNGTKAEPREFPHMALIGYGDKNDIQWKCGGSLISERWVLSAAHCTLTGNDRPKWVRLGEYNVRSTQDDDERTAKSEDFDIIEIINHPDYDEENLYNDIALYKLNRDVVFSEYVRPICLQTESRIPKRHGLITGWGRIGNHQRASDILLKGNVTFLSGRQCRDSVKTIINLKAEIRDNTMICAADFLSNTDTCQGDSGGPLQYKLTVPSCMYSQVGITSFGIRCASSYPAVYTRVSYFVPWIERVVWP